MASWLLVLLGLLLPSIASAQAVGDADREAAKERFARGVERMRAQDFVGAAEQFEKAYEIAPFAVILYNLGIAYDKLDRPIEAVDALQKVIDAPGNLRADRVARAKEIVAEQNKRIGRLLVTVDQPGAEVRIDGNGVGNTPLPGPHPVGAGTHFLVVLKSGFAPFRKEVKVAGQATETVSVTLEPTELAFAQIWVRTSLPQTEVWLDGTQIGVTPLEQSFPVLPGQHAIELRRVGYHSVIKRIDVGGGATAEIEITPAIDEAAVRAEGGTLSLAADELENLVLTVDGKRHGVYAGAIALAPGAHDVTVERAGFFPTTLRVHIGKGGRLERRVVMDPTPETIADHNANATLFTALGWTFTVAGVLAAGGGVGFTLWNENSAKDAEDNFLPFLAPGQLCDADSPAIYDERECTTRGERVDAARASRNDRRVGTYVLFIGAGALLATGITLLVLAPDSDKYKPESDGLDELGLMPIVAPGPDGGFVGISGRF